MAIPIGRELHLQLPDTGLKTAWIELTSTCPLRCTFCSRQSERGSGQHMDFALFEGLIAQLDQPETIRLNYSGESLHYPRLGEAIRLARQTGATTEIVTALASAPRSAIEALVDARLHRLSVSLHSLDSERYARIYRAGSVRGVRSRLNYLRAYQRERGSPFPEIDFAFVAMGENLADLEAVAAYACELNVKHVSVHPVIQRTPTGEFSRELDGEGRLRAEFRSKLAEAVAAAARGNPRVSVGIARPMEPGASEEGAGIATCEQNPWNTAHILADGSVVPCEVQDRSVLGNLRRQSLAAIWKGAGYREFRREYLAGMPAGCRACPWRVRTNCAVGQYTPVRGWHPAAGDCVRWSEGSAALAMVVPPMAGGVTIAGLLPPAASQWSNTLSIGTSRARARIVNETGGVMPFRATVRVEARNTPAVAVLTFRTAERFCPAERDAGPDLRRLGFALTGLSFVRSRRRERAVERVLRVLEIAEKAARFRKASAPPPGSAAPARPGVTDWQATTGRIC